MNCDRVLKVRRLDECRTENEPLSDVELADAESSTHEKPSGDQVELQPRGLHHESPDRRSLLAGRQHW